MHAVQGVAWCSLVVKNASMIQEDGQLHLTGVAVDGSRPICIPEPRWLQLFAEPS
jgi:hypothetical protein